MRHQFKFPHRKVTICAFLLLALIGAGCPAFSIALKGKDKPPPSEPIKPIGPKKPVPDPDAPIKPLDPKKPVPNPDAPIKPL